MSKTTEVTGSQNPISRRILPIAASVFRPFIQSLTERRTLTQETTTRNTAICDHHVTHILQLCILNVRTTLLFLKLCTELRDLPCATVTILPSPYKRYLWTNFHDTRICLTLRRMIRSLKVPPFPKNAQNFSPYNLSNTHNDE